MNTTTTKPGNYRLAPRRMPSCRAVKTIDGVTYAVFVNDRGRRELMPLAQFLANSGLKVRVK